MAEEIKIPITLDLNASNAAAEGQKIGQQLSKGIEGGVKQIDASKLINVDALAQKLSESLKNAVKGLNLGDELSKAFANIDLSKSGFGDSLKKTVGDAVKGAAPSGGAPPASHVPPSSSSSSGQDPIATFAHRLQPILSSLEAVSMVLRGAPVTSSLQMVGQAVRDFGAARTAAGMGGGIPPGGGGGGHPPPSSGGGGRAMVPYEGGGGVGGGAAAAGGIASLFSASNVANLVKGGLVAGGIGIAVKEVAKYVSELGEASVKENASIRTMAGGMQMPISEFVKLREEFKQGGLNIEDYQRQFSRMAVTARREMPEVELKVKRAGDVAEEAAIKVREGDRLVAKSRDDRILSTDKVVHAEGELAKFEAIGAQLREQQARGAALGVGGAQVGLAGAKLQQAAAGVGKDFAPQEAALANIAGPLTVKGAKLGVQGARLAAEQARYQAFVARGGKDPDWAQRLAIEAADHGEKIAAHNIEQAKLHEQQAKTAEEKRVATDAAGAGPVAQANQAAYAAAQATAQARLHLDQARTSQEGLAISQQANPLDAERRRLEVERRQAISDRDAGPDRQSLAEFAATRERDAQEKVKYQDIEFLSKGIEGIASGKIPEGFDLNKASPEALRQTFGFRGGFKGGAITADFRKFLRGAEAAGISDTDQKSVVQSLFPGNRSFSGEEGDKFLKMLRSDKPIPPARLKQLEEDAARISSPETIAEDKRIAARKAAAEAAEADRQSELNRDARRFHDPAKRTVEFFDEASIKAQQFVLKGFGAVQDASGVAGDINRKFIAPQELQAPANRVLDNLIQRYDQGTVFGPAGIPQQQSVAPPVPQQGVEGPLQAAGAKIEGASNAVPAALGQAASAIQQKATEISGIVITAPKSQGTVEGTAGGSASATELAGGGQVSGHGSQTSDDIPIMASNNEYMMQDAAVQKYGVPFMDAVNHGKLNFAGGGPIEIDERRDRRKQSLINIGGGGGVNIFDEPRSGTLNLAAGGSINYEREEELKAQLEAIQSGKAFRHPLSRLVSSLFGPSTTSSGVKGSLSGSAGAMLENVPMPSVRPSGASAQSGSNLGYSDLRVPAKTNAAVLAFANATAVNKFMENGKHIYELTPENVETARRIALGLPNDGSFVRPGTIHHSPLGTPEQLEGTKGGGSGRQMLINVPGTERFSDKYGKEWYTDRNTQPSRQAPSRELNPESTYRPSGGSLSFALSPDKSEVYLGRYQKGMGFPNFPPGNFGREEFDKAILDKGGEILDYSEYRKYYGDKDVYNPNLSGAADNEAAPTKGNLSDPHDPGITGYRGAAPEGRDAIEEERRRQGLGAAAGGHIGKLMRGFAGGGLIGGSFGNAIASVPGYAGGGAMVQSSSGPSSLTAHQLDLRTDAGDFSAKVDEDTLRGINNSSLSRKLTSTGPAPTWWS